MTDTAVTYVWSWGEQESATAHRVQDGRVFLSWPASRRMSRGVLVERPDSWGPIERIMLCSADVGGDIANGCESWATDGHAYCPTHLDLA